jgi:Dipeptidyl aminopeptidases/acylaminoacyl-peptidases
MTEPIPRGVGFVLLSARREIMRPLLLVLLAGAILYLALITAAWAGQERMAWQPPASAAIPEARAQRLTFTAEDSQPLYAYLVGDPQRAPGLLIAFHGNAELAAWNVAWAEEVTRRTGWAVLLPEYRGYGGLPGNSDYAASQRDARAAFRLANETLGVDGSRIALFGHSLGSAVATELAAEQRPTALVLQSPFTSARDIAARMPGLPLGMLWPMIGRVRFDTRAKVAALDAPVFVAHGERDAVVPALMGREVHAAAKVKGALLLVPEAGHNDVATVAGEDYWTWLRGALPATPARL